MPLRKFINLRSFGTRFFLEALGIGAILYLAFLGFYIYHFIRDDFKNKKLFLKTIKTELNYICEDLTDKYFKRRLSLQDFSKEISYELKKNLEEELKRKIEDFLKHQGQGLAELDLKSGSEIPYFLSEKFQCEAFSYSLEFGFTKRNLIYYFAKEILPLLVFGVLLCTLGFIILLRSYLRFKGPLREIEKSLREGEPPNKVGYVELDLLIEAIESYVEREKQLLEAKRLLEEEMARQEKLSALGRMAGGLAHEFNNLLQMILANLELARLYLQKNQKEEALRHILKVEEIGGHGQALASRMLFLSKPAPGETTDLCNFLKNLEPLLRSFIPRDINFTLGLEVKCPLRVPLSEEASKEVLLNLIKNAVDALEGPIKEGRKKEIRVQLKDFGKEVMLEVSDTGCGMTEEQKKRIFEPFYTTKGPKKGTGLGLYLIQNIISSAGGRIEVEGFPEDGSTFRIYLPVLEVLPQEEKEVSVKAEKSGALSFRKVLLVDDEEDIRETLKEFLELEGLEVHTAPDGKSALEKILSEKFDLLLVDLFMPERDGLSLIKEMEKTLKELPYTVIMTGYAGELTEELKGLIERGVVKKVLKKPFSLMDLKEILQNP
jgi:signal transduction histidine kinase